MPGDGSQQGRGRCISFSKFRAVTRSINAGICSIAQPLVCSCTASP